MSARSLATAPLAAAILFALAAPSAHAEERKLERIQVTATREAEPVLDIPASVTVITDEDMRARGATDLRSALALVAGVEISPGGDGGPAGSVPAFWGLREFDAFLLVVDGVPYGGAYNPQLTTIDLVNVERIEVMRGAAPVMYGATSFVGVIHVIHYKPGEAPGRARIAYGSFGTIGAQGTASIGSESLPQSISFNGERRQFDDDAAEVSRGHLLYRAESELWSGHGSLDFDATVVRQSPNSPSPRAGRVLDPTVPIDANHNPQDAGLDEDRFQLVGRYGKEIGWGDWNTTFSWTGTNGDFRRGFLAEDYASNTTANANGFAQDRELTDVYFDTNIVQKPSDSLVLTYGVDWLYGKAELENELFEYFVPLDGSQRPISQQLEVLDEPEGENERNFLGAYLQADWHVNDSFDVLAGIRLNHTDEDQEGEEDTPTGPVEASDSRTKTKLGGVIGASWHVWRDGGDGVTLYADARSTYKPAALDFGPEAEAEILEPEEAESYEAGVKATLFDGRFDIDASLFYMNFDNLVVAQPDEDGLPGLVNAGEERFKGGEIEAEWRFSDDFRLAGSWAYHDARFTDSEQLFGSTLTQLRGKFLELSPQHLGALGLIYAPRVGWQASVVGSYVGDRWLNKRNTARAAPYTVFDASFGYRFESWEFRATGYNLDDDRDPVAESELGDAQYYRLHGRTLELSATFDF
ncbi:MAG TPA: TonB-dependent receptor [Xanthomonadales bacterium]|nr:TonB-dependent receptor [Xanthomonadales bacterium]